MEEGEEAQNGITAANDGVYIVGTMFLYKLQAAHNRAELVWRQPYDRGTFQKVGMLTQGSGTAPTAFGDFITINDNADDRVNLLVYYRHKRIQDDNPDTADPDQLFCKIPMFESGKSASDNSMVAIGNTVIMENNYGFRNGIQQTKWDRETIPGGIQRFDLDLEKKECKLVWTNNERAPSCVAKLAVETGLAYYYTFDDAADGTITWFLTAIDVHTGKTAWKMPTGTGRNMDNNWGPVTLGPDGTAYVGVLGGIIAIYDS